MLILTIVLFFLILWPILFVVNYWLMYKAMMSIDGEVSISDKEMCKLYSIFHIFGLAIALVFGAASIYYFIKNSKRLDEFLDKIVKK